MATSTIFAKVDCLSQYDNAVNTFMNNNYFNNSSAMIVSDVYIGLYKFLTTLSAQGITELVTFYSGSQHSILGGRGGLGNDYWDQPNAVGANAFSVWRFKPYGERAWDWYLYIHLHTGSSFGVAQGNLDQDPKAYPSIYNQLITNSAQVFCQAAFSMSGSSTTNPWNGTINLSGNASKGNPVWSTGSVGYEVFVFPRINSFSGAYATSKQSLGGFFTFARSNTTNNCKARYHYFSDGHSLLFLADGARSPGSFSKNYNVITYIGPYRLMDAIVTGSYTKLGSQTSSLGMCMFSTINDSTSFDLFTTPLQSTIPDYFSSGVLGFTASSSQAGYGSAGVFATKETNVRNMALITEVSALQNASNVGITVWLYEGVFIGNQGKNYDQMISVYGAEDYYKGFVGVIDTPLLRTHVSYAQSHELSSDGQRMYIGQNTTVNSPPTNIQRRGISVPWDGGNPPGDFTMTREGRTFFLTNYNW